MIRLLFLALIVTFTCGFNVRDQPERFGRSGGMSGSSAPAPAPRSMVSEDQLWKTFAQCKLRANKDFSYDITYLPSVKAMSGKEITISGFMLPLEAKEKSKHFLLERRAPTCAFCPPGEPNEVIEVFATKAIAWNENLATLSGILILPNDSKKMIFFQLKDAVER
jgi:uncharacterized protein